MFDMLDVLIERIFAAYVEVNQKWKLTKDFQSVNLKKKQVGEILVNEAIWNMIIAYRDFLAIEQMPVLRECSLLQTENNKITARIKQLNSVEYKIHRYVTGNLKGKVPIHKCFNDLFGIRIIINADFSHEDLKGHLLNTHPEFKVTNATKNGYVDWEQKYKIND